eukprot:TRINITY_DN515_c0_g1_i2.p1 TRINITY_DN515_c0_g1~~TRINITY_DN515_c0_g1_i2.p1  ORF type:complete len:259 (-),score=80.87 TRINITY_DN515_c0_g1_i2:130-906(-)
MDAANFGGLAVLGTQDQLSREELVGLASAFKFDDQKEELAEGDAIEKAHGSASLISQGDLQMTVSTKATSQDFMIEGVDPPKLQNVVSTVNLDTQLDLKTIALRARNAEFNPKRFAAVIMRMRDPKTTALVFKSGKMVITGARSEDAAKKAAKKFALIIRKIGFDGVKFKDFTIQNIVASADVKFPIKLPKLYQEHSKFCQYEPELFPGLIYKLKEPKIALLIFVSGRMVLTGAKRIEDIHQAFKKMYPSLQQCRKQT